MSPTATSGAESSGSRSNPQSPSKESSWQATLDRVVPAIVALQVTAVRSFQDETAGAHGGTGFVVDSDAGLMLTNRHVCTCSPERTTATFVGFAAMEEVPCSIAYVDPIHDFAFLRFDPESLRRTPKSAIELDPSGCVVGEEIRVVGNDNLEKLQILSGTVARVDRNPPDLAGDFSDENTFYVLAGSGTRGGSSGSPVLNKLGRAIAINAAAMDGTMHAFYLPLHRVKRALEAVKAGAAIPRGTLCTQMAYTSFPEVLRLGVDQEFVSKNVLGGEIYANGTFTEATPPGGLLQVRRCIPGTPAASALEAGDVLLELNGKSCVDFVQWDAVLDASVGKEVALVLSRGGQRREVRLEVQDQHELIPHTFFELAFGVFHNVPYQTAVKHHVPLKGVYVAHSGFVFGESVKSDAVILEINGSPCDDVAAFEKAMQSIPNKEYFTVGWMQPKNDTLRRMTTSQAKMLRHWCPTRSWSLDPYASTRTWKPRCSNFVEKSENTCEDDEEDTDMTGKDDAVEEAAAEAAGNARPTKKARKVETALSVIKPALCNITFRTVQQFDMELVLDGENMENDIVCCKGTGILVEPEKGLVLTDRSTVPQLLGDIEVSLGEQSWSASVLFMHPVHSIVVLKIETSSSASTNGTGGPFASVKTPCFDVDRTLEPGEEVDFVGIGPNDKPTSLKLEISEIRIGNFQARWPPRWHESNLEAIMFSDKSNNRTISSGVLCDSKGAILGLHAVTTIETEEGVVRVGYGIPSGMFVPCLEKLQEGINKGLPCSLTIPSLEVMFKGSEIMKLRRLPARLRPPAAWLSKLAAEGSRSALRVSTITAGGPCENILKDGDLLVALNDKVVTTLRAVEATLWELAHGKASEAEKAEIAVELTVIRGNKERKVPVTLPLLGSDGSTRLLCWNGLLLQEIPRSIREFGGTIPKGLYISQTMLGSPAEASSLEGDFLLKVDGHPTPTLDALLQASLAAMGPPAKSGDAKLEQAPTENPGEATSVPTAFAAYGLRSAHIRVETSDCRGRRFVRPLQPDPLFWPLTELKQDSEGGWSCREYDEAATTAAGEGSS